MVESPKIFEIFRLLRELYPHAQCELNFSSPFELLIATILSAQCTDRRVNLITKDLFAKYKHPSAYVEATLPELEGDIRSCGLYRTKAKNIVNCCRELCSRYECRVPVTIAELRSLPGVGRKTANVVAATAFHVPALGVDTHVYRLARRLGLAFGQTPEKVEQELCAKLPPEDWIAAHHLLIWHGRRTCHARKPDCAICPLANYCDHHTLESRRLGHE